MIEGPWMMHWLATMHHDDQRSLAANEVYEQLQEGVEGKCLTL